MGVMDVEGINPEILTFLNNNATYLTIEESRSAIILSLKSMTSIQSTTIREGSTLYIQAQIHYISGLLPEGDKI